jgi:hypothetical protein
MVTREDALPHGGPKLTADQALEVQLVALSASADSATELGARLPTDIRGVVIDRVEDTIHSKDIHCHQEDKNEKQCLDKKWGMLTAYSFQSRVKDYDKFEKDMQDKYPFMLDRFPSKYELKGGATDTRKCYRLVYDVATKMPSLGSAGTSHVREYDMCLMKGNDDRWATNSLHQLPVTGG